MSYYSSNQPWSNGPNAPQIPYILYTLEKQYFAGDIIAAVFYGKCPPIRINPFVRLILLGIATALFFQCMSALLYPVRRTAKSIKWGLVVHTAAMFSFLTIGLAMNRNTLSASYIDDREFPGGDTALPGPLGYLNFAFSDQKVTNSVAFLMFPLNQWLADGLLVSSYRTQLPRCLTPLTPSAVPLLCDLFYELLGHRPSIPHVSRLHWYMLESSPTQRRRFRLTSLTQEREYRGATMSRS